MTSSTNRKRTYIKCSFCDRVNYVRKDYLKALKRPYRCKFCFERWRPKTFEDKQRISVSHRKFSINESFFGNIDSEVKAYWLGFLMADGSITENKIRVCLNAKDRNHLLKWKKEIGWEGKDYYRKISNSFEVYFRSLKMKMDLEKYFVTERKSLTTDFPTIPIEMRPHFIRGLFDADGCITKVRRISRKKSGRIYISYGGEFSIEGSFNLVKKIQEKFIEIGLPENSTNYGGKKISRVRYGGINQLKSIYNYLYGDANVFLERKKILFDSILENYNIQLIK